MFRKFAATAMMFRAILMIGHGIVWFVVKQMSGTTSPGVSNVSSVVSMVSVTGGLLLMTFAFLASRRGKDDLAASNAALDADALSKGTDGFDADAVMKRYLANKSAQSANAAESNFEPAGVGLDSLHAPRSITPPGITVHSGADARPSDNSDVARPVITRPVFGRKAA